MKILEGAGTYAATTGSHWAEHLEVPDLSCGTYSLCAGGVDPQSPHTEDEIYVVTRGAATLWTPGGTARLRTGDVAFVPAGEPHRFVDIVEDFAVVVVFGPAEYTRAPEGGLPTPTLHTTRLRLRPFTAADSDALFALHSSAHVLRYWDSPPWSEPSRAERFIAACRQMAEEGSGARLAIELASDGAFLGWCSLTRWNPDYRSAALGYCLGAEAWGHGYATEAARAVLQWAYDTVDLNRVQAEADTRNVASARVLEKLGFVREGTLREDCVVNGDVSDSWVYGLLRSQWQPSSEPDR